MVEVSDTIYGFTRDFDYSVSIGASTKVYGNFMPLNPKSNIKGIRQCDDTKSEFQHATRFQ